MGHGKCEAARRSSKKKKNELLIMVYSNLIIDYLMSVTGDEFILHTTVRPEFDDGWPTCCGQ
jgi:hypothetical protein